MAPWLGANANSMAKLYLQRAENSTIHRRYNKKKRLAKIHNVMYNTNMFSGYYQWLPRLLLKQRVVRP